MLLVVGIAVGCSRSPGEPQARVVVQRLFEIRAVSGSRAAEGLYSPIFFDVTAKDTWVEAMVELDRDFGKPRTWEIALSDRTVGVGVNGASGVSYFYTYTCQVTYELGELKEEVSVHWDPDSGEGWVVGHVFRDP